MITRQQASKDILNLSKSCDILYIECATGFGKSKMAIDIQRTVIQNNTSKHFPKTLILIAEKAHQLNWEQEYKKFGCEPLLNHTEFYCYASIHKLTSIVWDLIICDEAHHLSPLRIQHLSTMVFRQMILMSATLKNSVKDAIQQSFKNRTVQGYKVTTDEAIEANILPEPKIFIHQLLLNSKIRSEEIVIEKKRQGVVAHCTYPERWIYLTGKEKDTWNKLVMFCTQQEKYNYLADQVNFWKQKTMNSTDPYCKNKWMRSALDRKVFLGELKTEYVKKNLLTDIKNEERMICFCTSIEQANELGIGGIVHSKVPNVDKVIKMFQNKETNALFCVNMLKEGMNLTDINTGIIIQLDNTELSFIQKLGRVLRADSPNLHIIYYKNTRDADYLSKILKLIDRKYIKVIRPNKIKHG
jgi:superfamily II DNA or RNA helicase